MQHAFVFPVRVYYEDTDAGGIVYYGNYSRFFERARTEWLRHCGVGQQQWLVQGVGFVVTALQMRFLQPAKLDDLLLVSCQVIRQKTASLEFSQHITTEDNRKIAEATVKVACIDVNSGRPRAIPAAIVGAIAGDG